MKNSHSLLHWLPRIICMLAIGFISIFSLDVFDEYHNIWQQLGALFMHLIPSFILLIFLIIAWKREQYGGILFIVAGSALAVLIYLHNRNVNHFSISQCINILLMLAFPFIVVGVLFLTSYFMKKKQSQ